MLIALRDISIGEREFKQGDTIDAEAQRALPRGRLEQLKSQRRIEEISDEADIAKAVEALAKRVAALEASAPKAKAKTAERKAA